MSSSVRRVAGAAVLIASITVVARAFGFARIVVFYGAVGENQLGQVYQAANTIPNIIFEIVAGGALASLVVPMLAGPIASGDRDAVNRTTSALLTWCLLILIPAAVLVSLLAGPLMSALSAQASSEMVTLGARMLRVFAPQLPLYGIGIILTGVLQAHHQFAWPALAPLLSSITVIGAYATFALLAGAGAEIGEFTLGQELVLSGGTTLGVAVLSLCLVIPAGRTGLRYRPTLWFQPEAASRVRSLALAGAVTIAAQQLTLLLVVYLTYPPAPDGSMVVYTFAQTVYFLPWGVLAVPVATSAYPALAEAAVTGDQRRYRSLLAGATRAVVLLGLFGAALLVAVAEPTARVIHQIAGDRATVSTITSGIMWFAPGLVGYSLFALLTRALYTLGHNAVAARVTVVGWTGAALANVVLVWILPDHLRVPALAAGNSTGMALLGGLLLWVVARRVGAAGLTGTLRASGVGVVAAVAGAVAGLATVRLLGTAPGLGPAVTAGILAGAAVVVGFAVVVVLGDRNDAVRIFARFRRRTRAGQREGELT